MNWPFKWFNQSSGDDDKRGTLIGFDERHEPVFLSESALPGHILLLGEARTGKTTVLAHLATWAMRKDSALVILDVDGDLLPILIGQVPVDRERDVHWIDFGNPDSVPLMECA